MIDDAAFRRGDNMNIYVGNLALETTEDELRQEFVAFGIVVSVTIMNDKYIGSGQLRGYGYVEMPSKSEGVTAINNLGGKKLRNRVVSVVEALPLSDKGGTVPTNTRSNTRPNRDRRREQIKLVACNQALKQ